MYWQLNRIQYPVYNLGPGKRIVLWTQGCRLRCPHCVNPSLWSSEGGSAVSVELLLKKMVPFTAGYDGITITGGEPFDQYEPLISFCTFIKLKTSLNVFVYSGYSLEEIQRDHPERLFMKCIDYLLDGRYVHELNRNESLRGSANQRLYRFFNGVIDEIEMISEKQPWSVHVSEDHEVFLTGIPDKDDLLAIQDELSCGGINLKFV